MTLFGGVISVAGVAFLMLSVFVVAAVGYSLGRITIKGVSLGTAGVFIVALLYGAFFSENLNGALMLGEASYTSNALKIIENIGLILFVTSVGFI
ncbi:MAG: permease, partial [Lachnospiraceae bacterium]|nr:permease [Lachnospiraceae bacterium]